MLTASGVALAEAVPLLAALLSLPLPASYAPLTLTPQRQRQRTFETLLAWLHADARPGIVPERVPLIASGPGRAKMLRGRVVLIRDGDHAGLHRRVLIEPGTD